MKRYRRLSVIVPVYNDLVGLEKCLRGIAGQSYPGDCIEVIVVDNGSKPPIEGRLRWPCGVRYAYCGKPGAYAARNAGSAQATGEILAFIDADCVPHTDWLTAGSSALSHGNGRRIIGGEVLLSEPTVRSGTALYQSAIGFQQQSNITYKGFTATANMFCTSAQMNDVGPFDEALLSGGDREWCWRARRKGFEIVFEPTSIVETAPRTRLRDAIRQARRVEAGRVYLGRYEELAPSGLKRYRTLGQSLGWVIARRHLSPLEKLRVAAAGLLIRSAAEIERIRLRWGSSPERR